MDEVKIVDNLLDSVVNSKNAVTIHGDVLNAITIQITGYNSKSIEVLIPEGRDKMLKGVILRSDIVVYVDNDKTFESFLKESFEAKDIAEKKAKDAEADMKKRVEAATKAAEEAKK